MEVKEGFQRTELGVIPNDWDIKQFVEVMTGFSSGQTPSRARPEYYTGNIKWITSGELNYNVIKDTSEKITESAVKNTRLKIIPIGTFLFAITGLEAEGTRGSCGITGVAATTNQSCMALYPLPEKLTTSYLYHFYIMYGNQLAFRYCQGTKQQSYTGAIAKILPITLPQTISEQTAIATALSDADALINSLEKLIAKKQAIKQGTMQLLLTGKKRLPGFSGEWEIRTLGDIGDSIIGLTYTPHDVSESGLLVLRSSNIDNNRLKFNDNVFVRASVPEKLATKEGDILICVRNGSRNLIGKCAYITGRGVGETFGAFMSIYRSPYNQFLFHLFQSNIIKKQIEENIGATINQITNKNLNSFEIRLPPINEQIAIGEILRNMNTEIDLLEQNLSKYHLLKQSMMQNLLTGKIRLI